MIDRLMSIAFASAHTAIFDIGSLMAVLMLVVGVLDYYKGEQLRQLIERRRLDRPELMTALSLIPVDGTLLFQYSAYRRGSIRFGSLLAGIIGIGEEATYLIIAYQPLNWLFLIVIKCFIAWPLGWLFNKNRRLNRWTASLREKDQALYMSDDVLQADENFHQLPDKFRHKLHHFRYHSLGGAFWVFFAVAFVLEGTLFLLEKLNIVAQDRLRILQIPAISWLAMLALFLVFFYYLVVRATTREFGKIFEHEFESVTDAIGDLAETCAQIILVIFLITLIVEGTIDLIGLEQLTVLFTEHAYLAIVIAALIGLIPGTGASLAFTALYFALADTAGALPFAALVTVSIALIGDAQFIGSRQLHFSQRAAHLIAAVVALGTGSLIYLIEQLI